MTHPTSKERSLAERLDRILRDPYVANRAMAQTILEARDALSDNSRAPTEPKREIAGLSKYARDWLVNMRRESGGYPAEVLRHINILEEDVMRAERIADHLGEERDRLHRQLLQHAEVCGESAYPLGERVTDETSVVSTAAVLKILQSYRCQRWQYEGTGAGMQLTDVLTPIGNATILVGISELESLADFIAGELADLKPGAVNAPTGTMREPVVIAPQGNAGESCSPSSEETIGHRLLDKVEMEELLKVPVEWLRERFLIQKEWLGLYAGCIDGFGLKSGTGLDSYRLPSDIRRAFEMLRGSAQETEARCVGCGHLNRYHFDDGHGNVVCRFSADCACVHRAESMPTEKAP